MNSDRIDRPEKIEQEHGPVVRLAVRLPPAVEKVRSWVSELPGREFVGTKSRLNSIFELLRQMVFGSEEDPERRMADLLRRRAEIDAEIARLERGEVVLLGSAALQDCYQLFSRTARELMSDFRQVEENFRRLDRDLRQQIAGWVGTKGELLEEAIGTRDRIAGSDQGRSFQAFYDFLLSQAKQDELTELLEQLGKLDIAERDERPASRFTGASAEAAGDMCRSSTTPMAPLVNRHVRRRPFFSSSTSGSPCARHAHRDAPSTTPRVPGRGLGHEVEVLDDDGLGTELADEREHLAQRRMQTASRRHRHGAVTEPPIGGLRVDASFTRSNLAHGRSRLWGSQRTVLSPRAEGGRFRDLRQWSAPRARRRR